LLDRILSSSRKELKGQSAYPTQAIRKFYGSHPADQIEVEKIGPSEIQPPNKEYSFLTSLPPNDSDNSLESLTEHELSAIGDILADQPSVYAEVWTNNAHSVLELSHEFEHWGKEPGDVWSIIAILTGFLYTVKDPKPRIQEVEDSLLETDSSITPRVSYHNCPGYFVPVQESDATSLASILADDGSCLSYGIKAHHEALIDKSPPPSLRGYALSTSSEIDHTEHPAFRTTVEKDSISISTNHEFCKSHGMQLHHDDPPSIRGYAPSVSIETGLTEYPALHCTVDREGSSTRGISPPIAYELPALFASDEDGHGSGVLSPPTGPFSTIPDSPTLGGNVNRGSWYSCSLSPSEEQFLSEETPTLAPLCSISLPAKYDAYLRNEVSRSLWTQSHGYTSPYLHEWISSRGNRNLFPSQHEVQDDGAGFLYDGLDETLHDDLVEWFADGREDEDGIGDDDTMDDGIGDHGFSDAFLSSPLCPSNDQKSPRKSVNFEPLPENFDEVRATRATQDVTEALDDDGTVTTHNEIAIFASKDRTRVSPKSFGKLRAYCQNEIPKLSGTSRASSPEVLLAHDSPYEARPITRPTTPTDEQVNRYLQRTARPVTQTTSRGRFKTNRSYELNYAVNTTASLDPEISPEGTDTFASTSDLQPRMTPLYKKLAQQVSLSVVTSNEQSPSLSPGTPITPKTTPTKKKFRFTGSWGRKGCVPAEIQKAPNTVRGPELKGSPPPEPLPPYRTPLTPIIYALPTSRPSPAHTSPVTQFHYQSPSQLTAPSAPLDELPPIPPRNPRRLAGRVCNASFAETQRNSRLFFNQLDQNSRTFYAEQKVSHYQSSPHRHSPNLHYH